MATFKVKLDVKKNLTKQVTARIESKTESSVKKIAQELARTSAGATPHFKGDLGGSYSIGFQMSGSKKVATVEYSVYNNGFNYAIAMHEWKYKLGAGSQAKGGGVGMSGKTYKVGRKFLTRVLEGETKAYKEYIQKQIQSVVK